MGDSIPKEATSRGVVDNGNIGTSSGRGLYDHTEISASSPDKLSLRSQLIGAWELVSFAARKEDGSDPIYPLGKDATGIIMYTPDGYMSAQLQKIGQPPFKVNDLNGGTPAEWQQAGESYLAYTGPFYLDESGDEPILQHRMTSSSFPNWLGSTQRRLVEITEEGGQKHLTLSPESASIVMGEKRVNQIKWRRLESNQASKPPS